MPMTEGIKHPSKASRTVFGKKRVIKTEFCYYYVSLILVIAAVQEKSSSE